MRNASSPSASARRAGALLVLLAFLAGGLAVAPVPESHDAPASLLPAEEGPFWSRDDETLLLDYVFRIQNVGNLALSLSNHGFMGNNFAERSSSMEYPKGSEVDHMVRGGLWVGGIDTDWDTLVTTGVQDGYWGSYTRPTEWVPMSIPPEDVNIGWIRERSTLPTSPYYDPQNAISEQDFITAYVDTLDHQHTPETGNTDDWHNASGLVVTQESYAWSYEPADAMVLIKFTFVPTLTLSNAYFGYYAELTTGWKGKYPVGNWPPSSANWFHHHNLYWVDDLEQYAELSEDPLNLVAEHHYTYDSGDAPQHGGVKFLGAKYKPGGGEWTEDEGAVFWRWWDWEPGSYARDNDSEKFAMMAQPGVDDWTTITPSPDSSGDSPIQLLGIGPFDLFPGGGTQEPDSLVLSFAMLAGDSFDDLVENALYAQKVYSFNFTVPTPPHSPRTKVSTDAGHIRVLWEGSPEGSVDAVTHDYDFEGYRIYVGRSDEEASFNLLAQVDLDSIPAKNPLFDAYFTRSWFESEVAPEPLDQVNGQALLNSLWPGRYGFDVDAAEPFLVIEPDSVGYNTGLAQVLLDEDDWITEEVDGESVTYRYAYDLSPVSDGHHYWVSVTSYDLGNPETPSLESGLGQNSQHVIPGLSPPGAAGRKVTVFPNPYRGSAVWDSNRATGRYIWFAGLPARALVKVFTLAGDLVAEIDFDRDTYRGENAAGVVAGADAPLLSGTMAAWDLRSFNGQPVASGLYLFSVTDRDGGETQQGKFLVLK